MTTFTLCIDGGGSKTLLQILDERNELVTLTKGDNNGFEVFEVFARSSNINSVGENGVRETLQTLFNAVVFKDSSITLTDILPRCRLIAGMAGVGIPQNREKVAALFKEFGFLNENIHVMTDVDLALKLLPQDGIALICGTGSITMGKKGERIFREGGLGPILGDEGSAHKIGLALIAAISAEEYRKATDKERIENSDIIQLKKAIKSAELPAVFHVDEIRSLIPRLKEITPADFALLTTVVFQEANNQNRQAMRILEEAACALNTLIRGLEEQANLTNYQLDLHGGVFKSPYADIFIGKIKESQPEIHANKICNRSHENPVIAFAKTLLK